MSAPKVGEWREIELHDKNAGWYLITGFVLSVDEKKKLTEIQITQISVNPEVINGKYLVGKPAEFKTSLMRYCFMNDAKQIYYELMRDAALICNRKDEFMKYSEMIELMKD